MMKNLILVSCCLLVLIAVCAAAGCAVAPAGDELTKGEIAAEVKSAMDTTADPCHDFYRYACGGWLDGTELPSDQARWTRSFSEIEERNRKVVREMLEEAAASPEGSSERRQIGHFYGACMDEEAIGKLGAKPLNPLFERIATVEDAGSLMRITGELHRSFVGALFRVAVYPDFKDPEVNFAFFVQGGLGMPDRDYYVSEDEKKKALLADYELHVARMFELLGDDAESAAKKAAVVLSIETDLAKVSRDRTAMRDLNSLYNKIDLAGLKKLTPKLPWEEYLRGADHTDVTSINVATPEFFELLEKLATTTAPEELQTYLKWRVLDSVAGMLSSEFVDADFDFNGRKLAGQQEIKPRWKRCVALTQEALGEAVGKLYVEKMFAGSSKEVALEMIHDIESAFENSLPQLAWMDDTTRERALQKLGAIGNKIGYPDEWRDYSSMKISAGKHFDNGIAARQFEFDRRALKIGKPVDRAEWNMTPQTVNAYHNPLLNEIAFPAGILQPPFFHRDFPAAMNYGGIGGVIGHELTHGYDDQGRKFDPKGRMQEWWEPEVSEKFEKQAECVDQYYSAYEIEPGVAVNGKLTLGENIADIGGLKQGYAAYKLWEGRHGAPEPAVEGLTNEQLLFVSWAQVWCTVMSPEAARLQVTTDPHSPAQFRASGPVSHIPAFAEAFECEAGTPMNPKEQCTVW
jgi:predicted metalloendopeptidase